MVDHLDELADRTVQHLLLAAIAVGVGFAISFGAGDRRGPPPRDLRADPGRLGRPLHDPEPRACSPRSCRSPASRRSRSRSRWSCTRCSSSCATSLPGFDCVPPDVLEAADGMGYTRAQRLWRSSCRWRVPLIVAGLRLATVSTIGLVTVTAILGDRFGGLGFFILEGYRRSFPTELYFGAIPSILLALSSTALLARSSGASHPGRAGPTAGATGMPGTAAATGMTPIDATIAWLTDPSTLDRPERHPDAARSSTSAISGVSLAHRAGHRAARSACTSAIPAAAPRSRSNSANLWRALPSLAVIAHRPADHRGHRPAAPASALPDARRDGRPGRAADPRQHVRGHRRRRSATWSRPRAARA